jgi:hypothetical protein
MKYKWYDKYIVKLCYLLRIPFPRRIQKRIFATARLQMFRFIGMCASIGASMYLLYKYDCYNKSCMPIFSRKNFKEVTGIDYNDCYWTDEQDKYNRIKFLKWCEENV